MIDSPLYISFMLLDVFYSLEELLSFYLLGARSIMAMTGDHFIIHPQKFLLRNLLLRRQIKFGDFCKHFDDYIQEAEVQVTDHWKMVVSVVLIKILGLIATPLAKIGAWTEFMLNLFWLNGGLILTTKNLLNGKCEIPKRDSENFLSISGLLNSHTNIDGVEQASLAGDKFYAGLCAMASSLAYENELVVRRRVTTQWKMHFVKFYNLWNGRVGKKSTQAFIFCDNELDAKLIVLAFRGTQPFSAYDWQTDADISWYKIPNVGMVHLGFMEAMGVANRHEQDALRDLYSNRSVELGEDRPLAYHTLVEELQYLTTTHKNAKLLITGHSLGGALAVLFPALLFMNNQKQLIEKLMAVYTFGQPRVGDEEFGKFMDRKLNHPEQRYNRVVYCNDLVPRIPSDDKLFQFKHFGRCLYYNSFYQEQSLPEEPNRNFSLRFFVTVRLNALREGLMALILPRIHGRGYRETNLRIAMRTLMGFVIPEVLSHSMVNYINSVRFGPSLLRP